MAESQKSTPELYLEGVHTDAEEYPAGEAENHREDPAAPRCLLRGTAATEASTTEEPCEGKLHAGICTGGAGQPAFLP